MEMDSTDNAKSIVDKRGMQMSQYCLGLPEILKKILEQFSTTELLRFSLVSKLWNYEARSVMKLRGNLTANIRSGGVGSENRRRRLIGFASYLKTMRVVPISGINFHMYHCVDCRSSSKGSLEPFYKVILDRLPWKHFSVKFYDEWKCYKHCSALVLVKRILQDYGSVLEDLTLGYGQEKFYRTSFQDRSMPRLRTLTIESREFRSTKRCVSSTFIKALVSRAPNLQELHVDAGVDLRVNVLEGSSAVLVPEFRLRPLVKPIISEGLIGSIRSNLLDICIPNQEVDPRLLTSYILKLLEACRIKLEVLWMDLLFAVPLMCYGVCLENVTTLVIYLNCQTLEHIRPSILNLVAGLDFTHVFPKLTQVTIFDAYFHGFSADVVSAFVEQGTPLLNRALPDRAASIGILKLDRVYSIRDSTLPLLAHIFPDVKTVHVKQTPGCSFPVLRQHFLCLEKVIEI